MAASIAVTGPGQSTPGYSQPGGSMIVPENACATMSADWHRASIDYALQNVAAVTTTDDLLAALA